MLATYKEIIVNHSIFLKVQSGNYSRCVYLRCAVFRRYL